MYRTDRHTDIRNVEMGLGIIPRSQDPTLSGCSRETSSLNSETLDRRSTLPEPGTLYYACEQDKDGEWHCVERVVPEPEAE